MTLQQRGRTHAEGDHERATQRIDEIVHAPAGSREEAELLALLEAVERWESHRDRWSDWL